MPIHRHCCRCSALFITYPSRADKVHCTPACRLADIREDRARPLTSDELRQKLHYDERTGVFTWLFKFGAMQDAGDVAGAPNKRGYIRFMIRGKTYAAHRLAWLYMTGRWPTDQIDHIDLNKSNNAWNNLREATNAQNSVNRAKYGKRPYKGVCRMGNRFGAYIKFNKRNIYLGMFATAEEARDAFNETALRLSGDFVRLD